MKLRNKMTGEIIDPKRQVMAIIVVRTDDRELGGYSSIAELEEYWEDYEPKEPLVEDEKIRKAVRAWANALDVDEISYNSCAEYSEGRFEAEMGMADIDFGRVLGLKDGNYTIAELCGEEDECES